MEDLIWKDLLARGVDGGGEEKEREKRKRTRWWGSEEGRLVAVALN